jgi:prepilin-type N-terminal cleavage/methylation domain-containing protein
MRRQRSPGFTLIELTVAIVLVGILALMASTPLIEGLQTRDQIVSDLDTVAKVRYATERIARELRQAQYVSGTGVTIAGLDYTGNPTSTSGVCFTRSGGSTGTTYTTVAIRITSGVITYDNPTAFPCTTANAATTLVDNASSLSFAFYQNDPSGTGDPTTITVTDTNFQFLVRYVIVTVTRNTGSTTISHRTTVMLRNGSWT